jgi:hypothetical protein
MKSVKATVIPQQGLKENFFIEEFQNANLLGGSTRTSYYAYALVLYYMMYRMRT